MAYSSSMKTAVVGASGYAGGELLRLLAGHPNFEPAIITANSKVGQRISTLHPQLRTYGERIFSATDTRELASCELIFLALPHGESAKIIEEIPTGIFIVDLGADFRLESAAAWEKYYGGAHAGSWTYGLPELAGAREKIKHSQRVANPGCYATAIALATAPLLPFIDASDIVVVAASGSTGAGRAAKEQLLGSEIMGSLTSYKFGGVHQHTPEIEQALESLGSSEVKISFTPILAPMPRGILATVTARLQGEYSESQLRAHFEKAYGQEEFVSLLPLGELPKTSALLGSNHVAMQMAIDEHTQRIIISVAIDNFGKGAAGQALQNANLMLGLPENSGLTNEGIGI